MKYVNAIIGLALAIFSMVKFFNLETNEDLYMFGLMLITSLVFIMFYLYEEQKEEVERLRQIILKSQNRI